MAEYIEREVAICEIEQINPVDYGAMWDYEAHHYTGECLRDCKEAIDNIPAADVALVVHGRWGTGRFNLETGNYEEQCTRCRNFSKEYGKPYCPNCGAEMDGGDSDAKSV